MRARKTLLAACGLAALLLAVYVPATVLVPAASPIGNAGAKVSPVSTIAPLPAYSGQVVKVNYTSDGTSGQSGVFWTELWYTRNGGDWALYTPPWNPSGQWPGAPLNSPTFVTVGTILFDTFFTGGDARYNFTTVAVDRGFNREPGPSPDHVEPGAGHVKAKTIVDTTPPNVFIAKPTPNGWTNNGTLMWNAQDAVSGIASVRIAVDGGADRVFTTGSGSLDMGLNAEGDHRAVITAVDGAGNKNTVEDPFHYDPNAPLLQILTPAANSYSKSPDVNVTWSAQDTGAGIASLQLQVDSGAAMSLPPSSTWHDLAGLTESGHLLGLMATDSAGNVASQILSFGVDATPPTLAIVSPVSGSYLSTRQLQAVWSASDAGSGIAGYRVSLDDGAAIDVANGAGYAFSNVSEGAHTIHVEATDRAGNTVDASSQVTLDVTPPTVTITNPAAGTQVAGELSVNWTAQDGGSGLAQVFLILDSGVALGVPSTAVAQPFSSLTLGVHTVTVRVYDKAGNMAEATSAFTAVSGNQPGTSSLPSLDFWILMAIIGAIAIASAYFAVRRRKRPQG